MLRMSIKTKEEKLVELPQDLKKMIGDLGEASSINVADWVAGQEGLYECSECRLPLFDSRHKYNRRNGQPTFWQPIHPTCVTMIDNEIFGIDRTAIECARCGAHLGYVFKDGPSSGGLRFSPLKTALKFICP